MCSALSLFLPLLSSWLPVCAVSWGSSDKSKLLSFFVVVVFVVVVVVVAAVVVVVVVVAVVVVLWWDLMSASFYHLVSINNVARVFR